MIILYCIIGLLIILAALFLVSIRAGNCRSTAPFNTIPIAHRGLHTEDSAAPENSLEAFRRAKEAGYAVELDVQFTADKQIVVFHDATLNRVCGLDKRVDSLSYDELKALTLQGGEQHIPLLSEVLSVLDGTPLVCEIKSYGSNSDTSLCEAVCPLLTAYNGPVCIESFNPFMVRWFYMHCPQMIRGILSTCYDNVKEVSLIQGMALSSLMTNFLTRPDFVAYDYKHKNKLAFQLCRRLYRPTTLAWTILNQEEETDALRVFDNCIFEQFLPSRSTEK